MKILIVDNYDSFTFNLFQLIGSITGAEPTVLRNDAVDVEAAGEFDRIVLSPGPGAPNVPRDFGACGAIIEALGPTTPLLGVCLGHQGIVHRLGGTVIRAPAIVHGKVWPVTHDGAGLFSGLPSPLSVMRYHSLIADRSTIPASLVITAETDDGLVMGVRHRTWPLAGLQFHPESIGTPDGRTMIENFLEQR